MKIILATGIYPPQIGGPATYVRHLAEELSKEHDVTVVTYGMQNGEFRMENGEWKVERVASSIPVLRWWWYAQKLWEVGHDADIVYAFSSVSCGIPLVLSGLSKPKRILRLGGDFFWERYTAMGGMQTLRSWYESASPLSLLAKWVMGIIVGRFHHIVFSTEFQQTIYEHAYKKLPSHSVIENALPYTHGISRTEHTPHSPFRLLFLGRCVAFKNIASLIESVAQIPDCHLTIVGHGPQDDALRTLVDRLGLTARVQFADAASEKEKYDVFAAHDLLVLPSITEISPNTALEARAAGLPVLLTKEHGLSSNLLFGMRTAPLLSTGDIVRAILNTRSEYDVFSSELRAPVATRDWKRVASETYALFVTISAP